MNNNLYTRDDFIVSKIIGKGASAEVFEGYLVKNNEKTKVAIKIVKEQYLNMVKDEAEWIKNLKHKNIINIITDFYYEKNWWIVFEICEFGNLTEYMDLKIKVTVDDIKLIFKQIVDGLDYWHSNNIMHRDLKLDNIFITKDFIIKIGDFGFAKMIINEELNTSVLGTPIYMAPEIFNKTMQYSKNCDIWSIGMILIRLIFGRGIFAFEDITDILPKIIILKEKIKSSTNQIITQDCKDLISKLLEVNPSKRINTKQILNHPWLKINQGKEKNILQNIQRKNNKLQEKLINKEYKILSIDLISAIIIDFNTKFYTTYNIIEKIENIINEFLGNNDWDNQDFILSLYIKMCDLIYKIIFLNGLNTNLSKNVNELLFTIIQNKTEYCKYKDNLLIKLKNCYIYFKEQNCNKVNIKEYRNKTIYRFIKFIEKIILAEVELINNDKNKNSIINKYKLCIEIKNILKYELNNFSYEFKILKKSKNFSNKNLIQYIENNIDILNNYFIKLNDIKLNQNSNIDLNINKCFNSIFDNESIMKIFNPIESAIKIRINKINKN